MKQLMCENAYLNSRSHYIVCKLTDDFCKKARYCHDDGQWYNTGDVSKCPQFQPLQR